MSSSSTVETAEAVLGLQLPLVGCGMRSCQLAEVLLWLRFLIYTDAAACREQVDSRGPLFAFCHLLSWTGIVTVFLLFLLTVQCACIELQYVAAEQTSCGGHRLYESLLLLHTTLPHHHIITVWLLCRNTTVCDLSSRFYLRAEYYLSTRWH
jgi:hypothetical protein